MANLTTDRKSIRKDGTLFTLPVAEKTVIYAGALVSINAEGYAVPAGDRPGETFAGKADTRADNTRGANGDCTVDGHRSGVFEFDAFGMTQADLNQDSYVIDDNTVGLGIVTQPTNITGVTLKRLPTSRGGTRGLEFRVRGEMRLHHLFYGEGCGRPVGKGGDFVLTDFFDDSQILATVAARRLPVGDHKDTIQLRYIRCGKIVEVVSSTSVFVDIICAARG